MGVEPPEAVTLLTARPRPERPVELPVQAETKGVRPRLSAVLRRCIPKSRPLTAAAPASAARVEGAIGPGAGANLVRPLRRELEPRKVPVDRVRLHHVPELRERGSHLDAE